MAERMIEMELLKQLEALVSYDETEQADQAVMIAYLKEHDDAFLRSNRIAHFTASAWIVNQDKNKVLLIYHNIYDSWGWCGGHADGERDLLACALKEAREETGLEAFTVLDEKPLSCEIAPVFAHRKNGKAVNAHLHLNVTYALMADDRSPLRIKPDENSGVKWFAIDHYEEVIREQDMLPIYRKLTKRILTK